MLGKIVEVIGDTLKIKLDANIYELDNLVGARTKKIRSKLNQIESLTEEETRELLESE